jgi:hypothetical protein
MKRLLIVFILLVMTIPVVTWAQGYEAVTITSASKALTSTTYLRSRSALCRLETAPIRYTVNGTTVPTALVGIVLYPLEWIILENTDQIRNFRGFATTATDASLKCFYFE